MLPWIDDVFVHMAVFPSYVRLSSGPFDPSTTCSWPLLCASPHLVMRLTYGPRKVMHYVYSSSPMCMSFHTSAHVP